MGRLNTAKRVLQTQGVAGLIPIFRHKLHHFHKWQGKEDNWWYGKFVELRGNIVQVDGYTFNVNSPVISTTLKSRFLFNNYETPEREALQRFLDPARPVVELGGSVGVVACLTNRKLIDPKQHVVVEANPSLIPLLEANRERNHCSFKVLPRVIAYDSDYAILHSNITNFLGSSVLRYSATEEVHDVLEDVRVKTITLRDILDQFGFESCTLICDIEGAEVELVARESALIRDRVATLIMEVHESFFGKEVTTDLLIRIERLGFESIYQRWDTYVFRKR